MTPDEIDYEIDEKYFIPESARGPLSRSLSFLPEEVINFAIDSCVFISLEGKDYAEHIGLSDFRLINKKSLIFISATLWKESESHVAFVIAHEIAHAYKKHAVENIDDTNGARQVGCEREADDVAEEWLHEHFPKTSFAKYRYKDWQLSRGVRSNL